MAEQLPDLLTVEEAAQLLRIGRTAAYALARTWRETDGREGLPVVSLGRLLRVPRSALEAVTGAELTRPLQSSLAPSEPSGAVQSPRSNTSRPTSHSTNGRRRTRRSRQSATSSSQDSLPF